MSLQGKTAIVTGAAQGIGAAIVHKLAEEGAQVAVIDLNLEAAQAVVDALEQSDKHLALAANVGKSKDVISTIRKAREVFGKIDLVVNNAGIGQAPEDGSDKFYEAMGKRNEELAAGKDSKIFVDHLIHMEDAGWQGVMDVNLNGAFYVCREAVRIMAEDGRGGSIVNISSTSAQSGEGSPHYVTSKTALVGLTRQLAREVAPRGIRVNAVAPGPTNTPIMQGIPEQWIADMENAIPLGRMAEPKEIAAAVAFLLSDEASFVTGSLLAANGGSYYF
ncbi:MAG: SDR family NAD(P)-dependent oxidoreductase [Parvibaculales bacterium]